MNRGDVWRLKVMTEGHEEYIQVVIISNNSANKHLSRVQIAPITSKVSRVYPCEAYIKVSYLPCKVMIDQTTTVFKENLVSKVCSISDDEIYNLNKAIKVQFGVR